MYYQDANDPYSQQTIPYQSYRQQTVPNQPYNGQNAQMMPPQHTSNARISQRPAVPQYPATTRPNKAKTAAPRKSKAETLAFVHECKKWLVAGSIVTFGLLGGLVAGHAVGTTSNQATPANNTPSTSPSTNGGNDNGGGFFNQQPGQQQQQQGGGGYGFGNNNNPSQPPVSGSQAS
ncbi:MAG TPA: hypothetical protein VE843_10815 [Ktedonobacteraceae bacterium]|nr:hypothetical protein [Ktedonobacteraceae bacterium]